MVALPGGLPLCFGSFTCWHRRNTCVSVHACVHGPVCVLRAPVGLFAWGCLCVHPGLSARLGSCVCVRLRERARRNARGGWAAHWGPASPMGAGRGKARRPLAPGFGLYLRGAEGERNKRRGAGAPREPEWDPRPEPSPSRERGPETALGRPAMEATRGRGGLAALWCLGLLGGLARVAGTHHRYFWRGCYPCQAGYPVSAGDRRPGARGGPVQGAGRDRPCAMRAPWASSF